MFNFEKQKNNSNRILRERKYRPSFFGLSVHCDWQILLIVFVVFLILIIISGFNLNSKISDSINKDFSEEATVRQIDQIDVEKFDQILKKVESN